MSQLLRYLFLCMSIVTATCAVPAAVQAQSAVLTSDFEVKLISSVGGTWQTVSLQNSYTTPVVVCTHNLASSASPPAVVRVRNAGANSFEVRLRRFEDSSIVTSAPVHCIIADEGVHTLPGGQKYEAHLVLSDGTSGSWATDKWNVSGTEEVTSALGHSYSSPVVLGQVMTENDTKASVFWTYNCASRGNPPLGNGRLCVGKHISLNTGGRNNETLGYIVAESGSGTVNGVDFALALGADNVLGVGNNPSYNYNVTGDFDIGVVTQNAEDGGNGSWGVLYGTDPLPNGKLQLAVDESNNIRDLTRRHTTEQISYWLFKTPQGPVISVAKSSALSPTSGANHFVPGAEVDYLIEVSNSGAGSPDTGSLFVYDILPGDVAFINSDIAGAGSGPVQFTDAGSSLTFTPSTDLAFHDGAAAPTSMADCSYTPSAGADPNVRYICANPQGALAAATGTLPSFSLKFRVEVN